MKQLHEVRKCVCHFGYCDVCKREAVLSRRTRTVYTSLQEATYETVELYVCGECYSRM